MGGLSLLNYYYTSKLELYLILFFAEFDENVNWERCRAIWQPKFLELQILFELLAP